MISAVSDLHSSIYLFNYAAIVNILYLIHSCPTASSRTSKSDNFQLSPLRDGPMSLALPLRLQKSQDKSENAAAGQCSGYLTMCSGFDCAVWATLVSPKRICLVKLSVRT